MIGLHPNRRGRTPVRNARLVREPDRVQTRLLLASLGLGLVVLVPLLANIWGHAEKVRLGYQLEEARSRLSALEEERRLLRAEHAALSSPAVVQGRATAFGLQPRRPGDTVVVRDVTPGGSPAAPVPAEEDLVVAQAERSGRQGAQP